MLHLENFRDLLEHALDAPTHAVNTQQIRGRIYIGIEQVGDEDERLLARTLQRDAAMLVALGAQPSPVFCPARYSTPSCGGGVSSSGKS